MGIINRFLLLTALSLLISINCTYTSSNLSTIEISAIYSAFDTTYLAQLQANNTIALAIQFIEYAIRGALQALDGNQWDVFTVTGSPAVGDIACAGWLLNNKWLAEYNYNNTGVSFVVWQDVPLPSQTILISGPSWPGPWDLLGPTTFNALQTYLASLKTQGLARLLT